jgi:hypothetical protein
MYVMRRTGTGSLVIAIVMTLAGFAGAGTAFAADPPDSPCNVKHAGEVRQHDGVSWYCAHPDGPGEWFWARKN